MKYTYPILLTPAGKEYVVYVPGLEINTQGTSVTDAMEMARDAIEAWGCYERNEKRPIPEPIPLADVQAAPGEIVALIDVNFHDSRSEISASS